MRLVGAFHAASPPFTIVSQMARAFRGMTGFECCSIMVAAEPPKKKAVANGGLGALERSLHLYPNESFALVQVWSPSHSAWRRGVEENFARAGYERTWNMEDEAGFRRWLHGARQRSRELRFLKDLGADATPSRWPRRVATRAPIVAHRRRPRGMAAALGALRSSGIRWNVCAVGYFRRAELPRRDSHPLMLAVHAVAFGRVPTGLSKGVNVSVSVEALESQEFPPIIERILSPILRQAGYTCEVVKGRFTAVKRTRHPDSAARECRRIFDDLMERAHTWRNSVARRAG